jgi:hypothetical protein
VVFFVLNRLGEILVKLFERAEITAIGEIHNAPIFRKTIFDRRSAHRDKGSRFQRFNGFCLGVAVFLIFCASSTTTATISPF